MANFTGETAKLKVRNLNLAFGCTVEGRGQKCPNNYNCIAPGSVLQPNAQRMCPFLVAWERKTAPALPDQLTPPGEAQGG